MFKIAFIYNNKIDLKYQIIRKFRKLQHILFFKLLFFILIELRKTIFFE